MPSTLVRRHTCERCKRDWYEDYEEGTKTLPPASIDITFMTDGVASEIKFGVLCKTCEKTIGNYLKSIVRLVQGKSPDRKARAKEKRAGKGDTPPPAVTPPNAGTSAGGRPEAPSLSTRR